MIGRAAHECPKSNDAASPAFEKEAVSSHAALLLAKLKKEKPVALAEALIAGNRCGAGRAWRTQQARRLRSRRV